MACGLQNSFSMSTTLVWRRLKMFAGEEAWRPARKAEIRGRLFVSDLFRLRRGAFLLETRQYAVRGTYAFKGDS